MMMPNPTWSMATVDQMTAKPGGVLGVLEGSVTGKDNADRRPPSSHGMIRWVRSRAGAIGGSWDEASPEPIAETT